MHFISMVARSWVQGWCTSLTEADYYLGEYFELEMCELRRVNVLYANK